MEFNATFLVSAISFIVFTFIMNKIFYAPLTKVIDERENFITGALNDAKNSENEANVLLKNKEDRLNETSVQARKIISDAAQEANQNGEALAEEAKRQSILKIEDAKNALREETIQTQGELKSKVKELAEVIASKVLNTKTHIENVNNELIDRILV